MNIKETKEIIAGMGEAAVAGKKAMEVVKKILKDGISASDVIYLGEFVDAMPDLDKMTAAVDNASVALDEMKELDETEVIEIIGALYTEAKRFNEA
jgi:hypothetical protein